MADVGSVQTRGLKRSFLQFCFVNPVMQKLLKHRRALTQLCISVVKLTGYQAM